MEIEVLRHRYMSFFIAHEFIEKDHVNNVDILDFSFSLFCFFLFVMASNESISLMSTIGIIKRKRKTTMENGNDIHSRYHVIV